MLNRAGLNLHDLQIPIKLPTHAEVVLVRPLPKPALQPSRSFTRQRSFSHLHRLRELRETSLSIPSLSPLALASPSPKIAKARTHGPWIAAGGARAYVMGARKANTHAAPVRMTRPVRRTTPNPNPAPRPQPTYASLAAMASGRLGSGAARMAQSTLRTQLRPHSYLAPRNYASMVR